MRIACLTDTFVPEINGVTNTLSRFSDYLCKNKISHVFFAPDYTQVNQDYAINSKVVRIPSVAAPVYPQSRLALPNYRDLRERLDEFKPDVIHVTTPMPIGLCGLWYAKTKKIPIVMSYHTNFDGYLKYYKLEHLENLLVGYFKWFHHFADLNLCPSEGTKQHLKNLGYKRLRIWSRGIDSTRFNPSYKSEKLKKSFGIEDRFTFLYVGRVAVEKGLDVLVESMKRINERYPGKTALVITGDGPFAPQITDSGLKNIYFTGFKRGEELSEIYAGADCFACPSSTETFGNVILEAMASGLPVICANKGGQLDFAQNGKNALLFEAGSAESLISAMEALAFNPLQCLRLSQGAQTTAQERDWQTVFNKLVFDYSLVCSKRYSTLFIASNGVTK